MPDESSVPSLRVGHGFDAHRIVYGRQLYLGGVLIPWNRGLLGHSDADVVLHAVMDAMLGALALDDIGVWFPDTDLRYRGIRSTELVRTLLRDPRLSGWAVANVDVTLIAEQPKIAPYRLAIRQSLAELLSVPVDRASIKATTTEGLGFTGQSEGMAAHAAVLLYR